MWRKSQRRRGVCSRLRGSPDFAHAPAILPLHFFGWTFADMITVSWTNRAARREQRDHPRNQGSHQGVCRLCRGEWGQPAGRTRHHPCVDRTQWRRQDDLLQSLDQVLESEPGPHRLQRARHHGVGPRRRGAARDRTLIPDLRRFSAPHGLGERAGGAATQARIIVRFLADRKASSTFSTNGQWP